MGRLVYGEDERVTRWVVSQWGDGEVPSATAAIGWEREGELVAGIFFDTMHSNNIFAHIASSGRVIPWRLFAAAMKYTFDQLHLERMTFLIESTNSKCLEMVKTMGAEFEFAMKRALKDGDLLVYVLWNDNRFWKKLCATGRA